MSKARVLYMGFGALGCHALRSCLRAGVEVVGVTPRRSDAPSGDPGRSVHALARALGLPLWLSDSPNGAEFVQRVRDAGIDYLISIQYDRILRPALIEAPALGCLNLHLAPLPRMRGCFPTKWAILRDEPAGVSWHRIDAGVDTGPILGQTVVPLNPGETDATLYLRLTRLGMELFDAHVPAVAARAAPPGEPQDESRAIYFPQAQPLDGAVDWSRSAAFIERAIRAFTHPPYPGLRAKLGPLPLELRGPVDVLPGEAAGEIPGVCSPDPLEPGAVRVSCGDGVIRLRTVLCDGHEQPALEALRLAKSDRFQVSST